ncbi:DUF2017 family protein [Luteolibacter flavescens]|uniref:DUF2017 family protein n=1 Tax=Luteolibacter flavescens TaxID=1859460 RepID=A0ABT3FL53_9BACT|nr:DUF2017 family protein [Luteolibacter flavescens]MCW1883909.1 DUF2017 family protein [Luteolibacter flavescens]
MKAAPTLEGGLRIDLESPIDWMVLRCIPHDARGTAIPLADRMGGLMDSDPQAEDWREFVVPELHETFDSQLTAVEQALENAGADDGASELFIKREEGELWYGALNQARMALEERYQFLTTEPESMTPGTRSAYVRLSWYQNLQYMLLRFVMR